VLISVSHVKLHWAITYTKLYQKDEKRRLDTAKEELASMKYHPIGEHKTISQEDHKHVKRKKLKLCNSCESLMLIPPKISVCKIKSIACPKDNIFSCFFA